MKIENLSTKQIERYAPSSKTGLNSIQVAERVECNLINKVKKKYSKSYLNIFVNNVCTFFNLLGLIVFIALIAISPNSKIGDFFFVLFYISNISIGIYQEIRAKKCIDKLALVTSKGTIVVRDGNETEIQLEDIVLDDIIKLSIGNQIPTDSIVIDGEIEVNESLLTGESVAVKKRVGDTLYAGSFVTSGNCYARAEHVGKDNYVETLTAQAKKYKKPNSEIMNSLKLIIKVISFIIVPIATAFMLKSILINHANVPTAILGTSTVVIGMIPAGMMLLTSVALATGILKLSRHNTSIQDLYSLEMLARVDTICFDKTGTITDGKMSVNEVVELTTPPQPINEVMSSMIYALKDNNQTAIALFNYFGQNLVYDFDKTCPFNSARKLSAVTFKDIGTYAFGAPEFVLDSEQYQNYKNILDNYAKKGLRVLLLAHTDTPLAENFIPNDFKALALFIIADNVREDAIETVKWFKDNDVNIKVISGDNPITVSEVSKRVGIDNADKYISLAGMSDEEVFNIADKYTIFGRVSPEQKAILIKALKAKGHTTAMTGDGVNDILAMKESDCAISVAAGSEAARNVSHIVLLDNNFNSMPKVVYEGRRVINNVQSSASLFLMKTIFTMLMAVITLCLPYMKTYPYRLSNMIMFEMFIIGIPSFFLSLQPNDMRVSGRFISYVIKKSLPSAILMIINVIIIEFCRVYINAFPSDVYTTMSVYVLTYAGLINLFIACRPFNKFRSVVFILSAILVLIVTAISLTGTFESILSLTPMLPVIDYWHHLLIVLTIVLIDIPLAFLLQKGFNKINLSKSNKK